MLPSRHDCATADAPLPTLEQALDRLLAGIVPIGDTETRPLAACLGRVLAAPVVSPIDVPGWDNSAMDGYAVRHADLAPDDGWLPVAQRIPAGRAGTDLAPGTAARIFTGAPLPPGADTVVMQEVCDLDHDHGRVRVPPDSPSGTHIRRRGEDLRAGDAILPAGIRLDARHLGLAAAAGIPTLSLVRRPRVAILATGDELRPPGEPLGPGQIHDSNRVLLAALLTGLGCEILDLGLVADTPEATRAALADGARSADLVLASGGISVGEEDHVRAAVAALGSLDLWSIAIRPGKPVAFGHIGGTPFLGIPGNPVSLFTIAGLIARPLILRLAGVAGDLAPRAWPVRAGFDWNRPDQRREYHRARLHAGADGVIEALVHPSRSPAVLSALTWAEGLAILPPERIIRRGEPVDFLPFAALLC